MTYKPKRKLAVKETGVFDQQFVDQIQQEWKSGVYKSVEQLKQHLIEHLDNSTANSINRHRIGRAILGIRSFNDTLFVMYNHILAHPSEGLKVY